MTNESKEDHEENIVKKVIESFKSFYKKIREH